MIQSENRLHQSLNGGRNTGGELWNVEQLFIAAIYQVSAFIFQKIYIKKNETWKQIGCSFFSLAPVCWFKFINQFPMVFGVVFQWIDIIDSSMCDYLSSAKQPLHSCGKHSGTSVHAAMPSTTAYPKFIPI